MVRDTGKHSPHNPEALFTATQAPVPTSRLFWARLLSRRPLFLLGSLWLITICVAAVAVQRLVFTNPEQFTATDRSQVSSPRPAAGTLAPAEDNPLGETTVANDAGDNANARRPRQSAKVTIWGLSSLVGLCALGSLGITYQAKAAARRRPKRRVRRMKPKQATTPTGPKRLRPYAPERDAIIVKGARAVVDTLPLTLADADTDIDTNFFDDPIRVVQDSAPDQASPRADHRPQGQPPQGQPPQPRSAESPQRKNLQTQATSNRGQADQPVPHQPEVLPQEEAHPLDWDEDSLAHALDLRQRRSLSSLM